MEVVYRAPAAHFTGAAQPRAPPVEIENNEESAVNARNWHGIDAAALLSEVKGRAVPGRALALGRHCSLVLVVLMVLLLLLVLLVLVIVLVLRLLVLVLVHLLHQGRDFKALRLVLLFEKPGPRRILLVHRRQQRRQHRRQHRR